MEQEVQSGPCLAWDMRAKTSGHVVSIYLVHEYAAESQQSFCRKTSVILRRLYTKTGNTTTVPKWNRKTFTYRLYRWAAECIINVKPQCQRLGREPKWIVNHLSDTFYTKGSLSTWFPPFSLIYYLVFLLFIATSLFFLMTHDGVQCQGCANHRAEIFWVIVWIDFWEQLQVLLLCSRHAIDWFDLIRVIYLKALICLHKFMMTSHFAVSITVKSTS